MVNKNNTPVVILSGGFGTRLKEETEFRPKPMVEVGERPILWHIMKMYSHYGFYRFIVCLGYKGNMIKDYFLNYRLQGVDVTVNTKTGHVKEHQENQEEWEITLVDTGTDTMTGARIKKASKYIDSDTFMVTYGDGVSDVDIQQLLDFHNSQNKLATVTSVKSPLRFGNLKIENGRVTSFLEKQAMAQQWINGGFFVFNKKALKYFTYNEHSVLEKDVLPTIVADGQMNAFQHNGFWHCMDTVRDHEYLQHLWNKDAPWKVWDKDSFIIPAMHDITQKDLV